MKRLTSLLAATVIVMLLIPTTLGLAQKSIPQVPITYDTDTASTINRRAQWIEKAKKEGELVWWSSKSVAFGRRILAEFNKVYPFIKVNFWAARGEESASKVEMEFASGKNTVDVIEGAFQKYSRWRKLKISGKFTHFIPGINKRPQSIYSKHGDWAIAGGNVMTPQFNTNLVSQTEVPKSWEDLLDPKWKGQINLTTDVKAWVSLALEEGGWGIEKTENYLRKLKEQNIIWTRGHSASHTLLIAGEFKIMGEGYAYHVMNSQKKGAPVDIARVNPIVVTGPPIGRLNKAPHPNAANLFLEWLLSPPGLIIFEQISGQGLVYPGSTTRQAKFVEGLDMVARTEEGTIKAIETGLYARFSKILGISQ